MRSSLFSRFVKDNRDVDTILKQQEVVKWYCDRNWNAFKPYIEEQLLNNPKNEQIQKQEVLRLDFEDGRHVYYKDNKRVDSNFLFPHKTIITLCGIPGGYNYFQKMEMQVGYNFCRIINFFVPGFDKHDERRGPYKGTLKELAQLINDFMNKLNIQKSTFILNSFGGLFGKYFAFVFPLKIESLILIASAPITRYQGLDDFYKFMQEQYDVDYKVNIDQLLKDEYRNQVINKYQQVMKYLSNVSTDNSRVSLFKLFQQYDAFNILKLSNSFPDHIGEAMYFLRLVSKQIPRMVVYGQKDDIIESTLFEEEIYEFIVGENSFKWQVSQQNQPSPVLDKSNFCGNYVFRFDDAAHDVHNHKSREIGILIKHFLTQLDYSTFNHKLDPKL